MAQQGEVWFIVQDSNHVSIGSASSIAPVPRHVDAFRKVVKNEMSPDLDYCAASRLVVYAPGTALTDEHRLQANVAISESSFDSPYVIVAPAAPSPQQGRNCMII